MTFNLMHVAVVFFYSSKKFSARRPQVVALKKSVTNLLNICKGRNSLTWYRPFIILTIVVRGAECGCRVVLRSRISMRLGQYSFLSKQISESCCINFFQAEPFYSRPNFFCQNLCFSFLQDVDKKFFFELLDITFNPIQIGSIGE